MDEDRIHQTIHGEEIMKAISANRRIVNIQFEPGAVLLAYLILIFSFSEVIFAATYYVDKNHSSSSDANPGTKTLPWKTIQHAAETAVAGDTVFIRAGTYYESMQTIHSGNSSDGPIVFSAFQGEKPVLDGAPVSSSTTGVIIDQDYITLLGLEVCNWADTGIWIENAAYLDISDCIVHHVECGIGIAYGTHDFVFNRVEVHHFTLYGFDASPSGGDDCHNGIWNDCVSHTGNDPNQNVDGFALGHGTQHDFAFNRCTAYDVYDGFDISATLTTLNRCLSHDCWNRCFKIWQDRVQLVNCLGYNAGSAVVDLDWDGSPGTCTLMNCTFFHGATYTVWVENPADRLHMTNCILAGGENIGLAFEQMGVANYQGDYNLFQNDNPDRAIAVGYADEFSSSQIASGAWTSYSGQDAHSVVASSASDLFVSTSQPDLHLSQASPALDHGTSEGTPIADYDGNPRPSGSGYDIGAYEYQSGTGMHSDGTGGIVPQSAVLYPVFPNPFNSCVVIHFFLPYPQRVDIRIFDISGRLIQNIVSGILSPGEHRAVWNAESMPSGIYLCRMTAGKEIKAVKLALEK